LSPILVRPVREQLEHDRVIRLLQAKFKRKHDVAINVGDERLASVKVANGAFYPDLVLNDAERGRRLEGVVEVETGESVNHLEAMSEWATFGRARVPFYLYVPAGSVEVARRLCIENHVTPAELWTFHTIGDQIRFTLIERSAAPPAKAAPKSAVDRARSASHIRPRKAGTTTRVAAASRRRNAKGSAARARPKRATPRKGTATRRTAASRESSSRSSRSASAPRGNTTSRRKAAPKRASAKRKTGRR
jgi:hypothetical protein